MKKWGRPIDREDNCDEPVSLAYAFRPDETRSSVFRHQLQPLRYGDWERRFQWYLFPEDDNEFST